MIRNLEEKYQEKIESLMKANKIMNEQEVEIKQLKKENKDIREKVQFNEDWAKKYQGLWEVQKDKIKELEKENLETHKIANDHLRELQERERKIKELEKIKDSALDLEKETGNLTNVLLERNGELQQYKAEIDSLKEVVRESETVLNGLCNNEALYLLTEHAKSVIIKIKQLLNKKNKL